MICGEKERETCNVEKLGCKNCYYDETEERMKDILKSFVDLAGESSIAKDLKDDIKATRWAINKIERLEQELEHYKNKKCLHCGSNEANYCEQCYQDLIGLNAKLQIEQHIPRID